MSSEDPAHSSSEIRLCLDDRMVVRVEQAVGNGNPADLLPDPCKALDECVSIPVVLDNRLPAVALGDDVMDGPKSLVPGWSRHGDIVTVAFLEYKAVHFGHGFR